MNNVCSHSAKCKIYKHSFISVAENLKNVGNLFESRVYRIVIPSFSVVKKTVIGYQTTTLIIHIFSVNETECKRNEYQKSRKIIACNTSWFSIFTTLNSHRLLFVLCSYYVHCCELCKLHTRQELPLYKQ